MKLHDASPLLHRALITGAGGMIGSYVDFGIRTDHTSLDVTDLAAVRATCREYMPPVIVHLAAATDLNRCEKDLAYAHMVNAVGTYNMALAAREIGAKLIYISTSDIFDGTKESPYTEDDIPNPPNHYAHSKYLGELAVQGLLSDYLILRVSWVFGGGVRKDQKFVGKIIQMLDQAEIRAVADKRGSPTYGKDVVEGIKRLLGEGARGIFHMSNAGTPTRADIAREIIAITGAATNVVEINSDSFPMSYSTGANEGMVSKSPFMRPWQEALREYLETEWTESLQDTRNNENV